MTKHLEITNFFLKKIDVILYFFTTDMVTSYPIRPFSFRNYEKWVTFILKRSVQNTW